MIEQYLKAHIFVCPSSVENSPNSLGEAQLLGVPCIGSIAGGIPSMLSMEKQDFFTGLRNTNIWQNIYANYSMIMSW